MNYLLYGCRKVYDNKSILSKLSLASWLVSYDAVDFSDKVDSLRHNYRAQNGIFLIKKEEPPLKKDKVHRGFTPHGSVSEMKDRQCNVNLARSGRMYPG